MAASPGSLLLGKRTSSAPGSCQLPRPDGTHDALSNQCHLVYLDLLLRRCRMASWDSNLGMEPHQSVWQLHRGHYSPGKRISSAPRSWQLLRPDGTHDALSNQCRLVYLDLLLRRSVMASWRIANLKKGKEIIVELDSSAIFSNMKPWKKQQEATAGGFGGARAGLIFSGVTVPSSE
ncbi:hypothetical protein Tco_0703958 [Tanacetum coccineum]|uniref:Uncharacterized protein n=1 Tax=Tanacetum coccineum TaxID=301880 RepID=A0ABQ4Y155_9ASTR